MAATPTTAPAVQSNPAKTRNPATRRGSFVFFVEMGEGLTPRPSNRRQATVAAQIPSNPPPPHHSPNVTPLLQCVATAKRSGRPHTSVASVVQRCRRPPQRGGPPSCEDVARRWRTVKQELIQPPSQRPNRKTRSSPRPLSLRPLQKAKGLPRADRQMPPQTMDERPICPRTSLRHTPVAATPCGWPRSRAAVQARRLQSGSPRASGAQDRE